MSLIKVVESKDGMTTENKLFKSFPLYMRLFIFLDEVWTGWEACLRSFTGLVAKLGWELGSLSPFNKTKGSNF